MIILSIPFLDENFVKNQPSHEWREYRLDYNENYRDFPTELIDEKTIITIRDPKEGGKFYHANKIEYYQKNIEKYDCLVDCEIELSNDFSQINPNNLILSCHSFNNKIDFGKLKKIIEKSNKIPAKFLKISLKIENYSDFTKLTEIFQKSNKPIIFAGMGKIGKISRILHKHFGAIGTFIGIENQQTASGQLTVAEAKIYNLSTILQNTKIGGIIGGKQVKESLGINFYNHYFQQHKIDAVYLPFIVENLTDFLNWQSMLNCYGFSITMPFKTEFIEKPINLFLPDSKQYFNTDALAFTKCIKYLKINNNAKILIYGSGGTAETALLVFQNQVYLAGRNSMKIKKLAEKYSCKVAVPNQKFDVIINCTPLGMNGENLLKETNLQMPKKIIDLPYSRKKTPVIQKCEEEKTKFVDGKMFWKWQAEKQLEKFMTEIRRG